MKFLIYLGSARDSTPPRPARLGQRVSMMCHRLIADRAHDAQIIDPLDSDMGGIFKPHFAYAEDARPRR